MVGVEVEFLGFEYNVQKMKAGDFMVYLQWPRRGRKYYKMTIEGEAIARGELDISIGGDHMEYLLPRILDLLNKNNRDVIALLMTFEPLIAVSDNWTNKFLKNLIGAPVDNKILPEKFPKPEKPDDPYLYKFIHKFYPPKRSYDVLGNLRYMYKMFIADPLPQLRYAKNVCYGATYLLQNFEMTENTRRALNKLAQLTRTIEYLDFRG